MIAVDVDPPSRVYLTIPGCASGPEGSCPLATFKQLMYNAVDTDCSTVVDAAVLQSKEGLVESTEDFLAKPGGVVLTVAVFTVAALTVTA